MKRHIVPSMLSADFANLERDLVLIHKAGAESVQIDVMDGHFVPNLTVGADVVAALRRVSPIFLDVHLMIENPLQYIGSFAKAGASLLTLHVEACSNPGEAIQAVKKLGVQVGLAVRPKTSEQAIVPFLDQLDYALVMTVEPGFGGQSFMADMLPKVRTLRSLIDSRRLACHLQVDGGINRQTAPLAAEAGASSLVAGSAVYGASDPARAFRELQTLVDLPSKTQVK